MTTEEIDEIIAEYDAGDRLCDIGKRHNIKTPKIIYWLRKYNHFVSKSNYWSESEILFFKENYESMSWDDLLVGLPKRSKQVIVNKASELNLLRSNTKFSSYTKEEDDIIMRNYIDFGAEYISKNLLSHRTKSSIETRAYKLGIKTRQLWTSEEEFIMKNNYEILSVDDILKLLPNRTRNSIISHARVMGLKSPTNRDFTEKDDKYIKDHYLEMSDDELAITLCRDRYTLKNRRNYLNLHRPRINCTFSEYLRAHNYIWKQDSMRACGYKCVLTGKRFDEIHHLYGMSLIMDELCKELDIDLTFDINSASEDYKELILDTFHKIQAKYPLGVCLTKEAHMVFHNKYGYGDNIPEQFEEFAVTYKIAC